VPMKDSEVVRAEMIPAHWTVGRIKDKGVVHGRVGWKALKASEYVDEGYVFLSTPNIKGRDIDFNNVNYITHERYVESPEIALREDDILLAKDGSTLGTVNIVSSLPRQTTVNSSIAVLRFDDTVFNRYLFYQIMSDFIQNRIALKRIGMGVPHLFQRDINDFFILLPPLSEQRAIVEYLDVKVAEIDRIVGVVDAQIGMFRELRKALINDVVTGKLRVT
jgi:type I restriction enzyme, S subunit